MGILKSIFNKRTNPKSKELDGSFNNIIQSINYSQDLYMKLISIYHPDRFNDPIQKELAEEYSKRINQNRYNYFALQQIEIELSEPEESK